MSPKITPSGIYIRQWAVNQYKMTLAVVMMSGIRFTSIRFITITDCFTITNDKMGCNLSTVWRKRAPASQPRSAGRDAENMLETPGPVSEMAVKKLAETRPPAETPPPAEKHALTAVPEDEVKLGSQPLAPVSAPRRKAKPATSSSYSSSRPSRSSYSSSGTSHSVYSGDTGCSSSSSGGCDSGGGSSSSCC
ncbi:hypothetical protein GGTG_08885 [Gaeumannomyces tritici R3-111a-1]|uniref:Uncharacterized protein n=1 Tax=Gaeumannomyces tritici (strain R3-111a-1) TaxID=644352 RepID=J3P5U5_GAET3|nr:hypothetical protein GGTG_08885 [Gaeumannomyces tritici R3-111a-1]EJT75047.1 hypothetical protein GGTG_08885 [Gaeumannomyces tritici R3-111a-1]